jgi:hypothetical protein
MVITKAPLPTPIIFPQTAAKSTPAPAPAPAPAKELKQAPEKPPKLSAPVGNHFFFIFLIYLLYLLYLLISAGAAALFVCSDGSGCGVFLN